MDKPLFSFDSSLFVWPGGRAGQDEHPQDRPLRGVHPWDRAAAGCAVGMWGGLNGYLGVRGMLGSFLLRTVHKSHSPKIPLVT